MTDQSKPIQDWKCCKCGHQIHITRQAARYFDGHSCEKCGGLMIYFSSSDKPWDFSVGSESSIPEVIQNGKGLFEMNRGMIDFKMYWHTDDTRKHVTDWEALFVEHDGSIRYVKAIGCIATVNSIVNDDIKTCEDAQQWIKKSESDSNDKIMSELKIKMTLDGSDAIHGLKVVQREIRNTVQQFKELDKVKAVVGIDLARGKDVSVVDGHATQ